MPVCPQCHGGNTLLVADHYQLQVSRPEADPDTVAPFAPPLRRSILPGTLSITLFWMAILSPGFVESQRAVMVALTFGAAGALAMVGWLRARKQDRIRMAAYQKARVCLDCQRIFTAE